MAATPTPTPAPAPGLFDCFGQRAKVPFTDPSYITSFLALEKRLRDDKASPYNDRLNTVQEAFGFISKPENAGYVEAVKKSARFQFHNKRPSARRLGASHLHIADCFPYVLSVEGAPEPAGGHPPTERVFDYLFKTKERVDHPNGLSGLFYALATIISLTLVRHKRGTGYNETSFLLDLSPLYGANKVEEETVRVRDGTGRLRPDEYFEQRPLTPSAAVLLILFNRNHNWIAEQLMAKNNKWVKPSPSTPAPAYQDEEAYKIARLINCAQFKNIVAGEFLTGLLGMTNIGHSTQLDLDLRNPEVWSQIPNSGREGGAEFSLLYHWSSLISKEDEEYLKRNPGNVDQTTGGPNQKGAILPGLTRNNMGYFNDDDLINILCQAIDNKAGAFRAQGSPECMRAAEIAVMDDARSWGVCSLNTFRKYLGLKTFKNFNEWNHNPAIAAAAASLYQDIDKLELYVGLQAESTTPGSGFCLGYTMTYALITDLVTMIRSDPNFSRDFKPEIYTEWGLSDCIAAIDNGAFGAQLPKIILRNLPEHYRYNSVYGLFPLTTLNDTKSGIEAFGPELGDYPVSAYSFDRPRKENVGTLTDMKLIREVLNNPKRFPTMYHEELKSLTEGYGYLLGFDEEKFHDSELTLTLYSLMPDIRSFAEHNAFYGETAERMLEAKHDRSNAYDSLDVVKDVIFPTCLRWACEKLCGFSEINKDKDLEMTLLQHFRTIHSHIFHTADPADGWTVRSRAISASRYLSDNIDKQLDIVLAEPPRGISASVQQLWREYSGGHQVSSTHSFLERLVKTSRSIGRFQQLVQRREIKALLDKIGKARDRKPKGQPTHWLLTWLLSWVASGGTKISNQQRLERIRVIANAIGLSVVSSINCSHACATAARFYLAKERSAEREKIVALARTETKDPVEASEINRKIMGYIHEAMRLGSPPLIWRNIEEGAQLSGVDGLENFDHLFLDLNAAYYKELQNPDSIDPDRKLPFLLGAGLHKCPAISLIDESIPELFKVIFRQEDLNWIDEKYEQSSPTPQDKTSSLKAYTTSLNVTYKHNERYAKWGKKWKVTETPPSNKKRIMDIILYTMGILGLVWRIYVFIANMRSPVEAGSCEIPELDVTCREPASVFQKWDTNIFLPGPDGQPTPIEYTMDHKKPHRLSLLDIDARDMQLDVLVDGVIRGRTTDFELDKTIDCGEDRELCLKQNFSAGVVVVPPGKHAVKIVWAGKEFIPGTNDIDWGDDYSRRMKWQLEHCA